MTARTRLYLAADRAALSQTIDTVCAGCEYMQTRRFVPTPAWSQALDCSIPERYAILIMEVQGEIVGWCRMFSDEVGPGAYELGIGITREYRRKGYGTALMQSALKWADERSSCEVVLYTHHQNAPAYNLFVKSGFKEAGIERDNLYMTYRIV